MRCAFCYAPEGKRHATDCPTRKNGQSGGQITTALYPHSKNGRSFEQGMEFQDWVVEQFNKRAFYVQLHASKRYQFERGESVQMVEIKLDNRFIDTGRLSIEVGERTAIDRPWVASGIYRNDNTVFYAQGNFDRVYLFDKRVLQRYHRDQCNSQFEESPRESPTVRKFYMPLIVADELCIFFVDRE
jgi:hypothetical protein